MVTECLDDSYPGKQLNLQQRLTQNVQSQRQWLVNQLILEPHLHSITQVDCSLIADSGKLVGAAALVESALPVENDCALGK